MLVLENLSRSFGATSAVSGASLSVAAGELVCLLGPSGCGKSTLLRMIAGLLEADAGRIAIDGADMTALPANRRPTAMVFQSHALWSHMSVAANVAFGLRVRGVPRAEAARRVDAALALVGLAGFQRRRTYELSGGQAQRVALARCLVVEPRVLLMDEPFSALDAHLRQHLREELKALQRRLGLTTLFVTHDQDEAMELADRIVVMHAGRIEQVGRPTELYQEPATLFVAEFIGAHHAAEIEVRGGVASWHGASLGLAVPDGTYRALGRPGELAAHPLGAPFRVARTVDLGHAVTLHLEGADGAGLRWSVGRDDIPAPGSAVRVLPRRLMLFRDGRRTATLEPVPAAAAAQACHARA